RARSISLPLNLARTAALARPGPMDSLTKSPTRMPAGAALVLPSGRGVWMESAMGGGVPIENGGADGTSGWCCAVLGLEGRAGRVRKNPLHARGHPVLVADHVDRFPDVPAGDPDLDERLPPEERSRSKDRGEHQLIALACQLERHGYRVRAVSEQAFSGREW